MRNPYFFVFLLSLSISLSPGYVFAKTTSKLTPEKGSQNLKSNAAKAATSKTTTAKKTSASSKASSKIQVDLSTVPVMGSYDPSSTEAGVYLPGIVSGPAPAVPYRNYSTSNYQNPMDSSGMMTTMGGILNLFSMAQQIGQRANPNAKEGPMFIGECKDCAGKKNTAGAPDTIKSSASPNITRANTYYNAGNRPGGSSSGGYATDGWEPVGNDSREVASGDANDSLANPVATGASLDFETVPQGYAFNSEPHMQIINGEKFRPFEGANPSDMFIQFGGSAAYHEVSKYLNEAEMSAMCSNYANLSATQQETLMMYMYSEILKQTSNYESYRVTLTPVQGGTQIESYGMCQLSLAQAKELKQAYPNSGLANLPVSSEEVLQSYIMDKGHVVESEVCALKIVSEGAKDNTAGTKPLQRAFPRVDFNKVNSKLSTLKMCARPANV